MNNVSLTKLTLQDSSNSIDSEQSAIPHRSQQKHFTKQSVHPTIMLSTFSLKKK